MESPIDKEKVCLGHHTSLHHPLLGGKKNIFDPPSNTIPTHVPIVMIHPSYQLGKKTAQNLLIFFGEKAQIWGSKKSSKNPKKTIYPKNPSQIFHGFSRFSRCSMDFSWFFHGFSQMLPMFPQIFLLDFSPRDPATSPIAPSLMESMSYVGHEDRKMEMWGVRKKWIPGTRWVSILIDVPNSHWLVDENRGVSWRFTPEKQQVSMMIDGINQLPAQTYF